MIDLHTHTTASDGVLSPSELIARALNNGVTTMAITDHDTVDGYTAVKHSPQAAQMRLISGVEISTQWCGMGIHMVGLDFDEHCPHMTALLKRQSTARDNRAQQIVTRLTKAHMPMSLHELYEHANTHHIGRPHIAQLMVSKGYVSNTNQAFKKYLGTGKIGDIKSGWVDIQEAVKTVVASGGIAVLAHPNHYTMTRTKLQRLLDDFQAAGGEGIEVISGKQHRDITRKFAQIANERGMYASLGSDFHRPLPYRADVGQLEELPKNVLPVTAKFASAKADNYT